MFSEHSLIDITCKENTAPLGTTAATMLVAEGNGDRSQDHINDEPKPKAVEDVPMADGALAH